MVRENEAGVGGKAKRGEKFVTEQVDNSTGLSAGKGSSEMEPSWSGAQGALRSW